MGVGSMDRKALIITASILIGLDSSIIIDHLGIHIPPLAREVFWLYCPNVSTRISPFEDFKNKGGEYF